MNEKVVFMITEAPDVINKIFRNHAPHYAINIIVNNFMWIKLNLKQFLRRYAISRST